jgi:hypothetical protein
VQENKDRSGLNRREEGKVKTGDENVENDMEGRTI